MKVIKSLKRVVFLIVVLAFAGCKDKDSSPSLANALLYGDFFDSGTVNFRLFAMRLHPDGAFTWYDAHNTFSGKWTQEGREVEFQFTSGAGNKWTATVEGNSLTNVVGPTPQSFNFMWIDIAKSGVPKKLKDTNWREINRMWVLYIVPGEPDGKLHMIHPKYNGAGSEGIIYDFVDKQVLIPSKTLNYHNYSGIVILSDDNLILHRYDPSPAIGEPKYGTYTFIPR